MKKLLLSLLIFSLLPFFTMAEPGDELSGLHKTIWLITAHSSPDILATLLTNMNSLDDSYQASNSQQEWAIWLKLYVAVEFGKIYYQQVYTDILSKIIEYNFGNAQVAPEYLPPQGCSKVSSTITCDEDPTGEERTILLWQRLSGTFTEQSVTGILDSGTWTFSSIPIGSNYVVAYDDNFQSLPSHYFTVSE
jgi:hypothetical protein